VAYQSPEHVYQVNGGVPPYTYSVSGVPGTFAVSGSPATLFGTPPAGSGGVYTVTVTVKDAAGTTASASSRLEINAAGFTVGPDTLAHGRVARAYGPVTLTASGGTAPHLWSATNGLPNGLTLSPAGVLGGTPAAGSAGQYDFTVTVKDAGGRTAIKHWQLLIDVAEILVVSPDSVSLPAGKEYVPYAPISFTATGGSGGYTWRATSLPAGLTLSTGGVLSGTPERNSAGSQTVSIIPKSVLDNLENPRIYSLAIAPSLTITSPTWLPMVGEGQPIGPIQFEARDGVPPLKWQIASGALPTGVTFTPAGVLSGAPGAGTARGYFLMIRVSDGAGQTNTLPLTLNVDGASTYLRVLAPLTLAPGMQGTAYGPVTFSATGGSGTGYRWSANGLPAAMVLRFEEQHRKHQRDPIHPTAFVEHRTGSASAGTGGPDVRTRRGGCQRWHSALRVFGPERPAGRAGTERRRSAQRHARVGKRGLLHIPSQCARCRLEHGGGIAAVGD
ncbi:MAG: putative Ig domain-containing protein, partial [Acidobacteria bacterium]|nr:putative Ig domain-containing protein [Acidobacteriota bacterium]